MAVVKKEEGKLPFGFYSKKSKKINTLYSCLTGAIIVFVFILFRNITNNLFVCILVCFLYFSVSILLISYNSNLAHKAIRKFYKDLDFNKLENSLQEILKENLHSETRNLLLIDFANILLNYNKERALLMWNNVKEPISNNVVYHIFQINFLIEQEKFDEAKSYMDIFKVRYSNKIYQAIYDSICIMYQVYATTEIIENIEKKVAWNKKNRFDKINKCSLLMRYFYSRGQLDHAIKYAVMIKEEDSNCIEINKFIDQILKEE